MNVTSEGLQKIFKRTDGNCHVCGKKMCFKNYGEFGTRGAWEIEHSNPRCKGGTDCLQNLYGAHISCNRVKGRKTTRAARAMHGRTRAPLSGQKKQDIRRGRALGLGALGAVFGAMTGGLGPAILLGLTGAALGKSINPEN